MECQRCGLCCKDCTPKFWIGSPLVKLNFDMTKRIEPDISDIVLNTTGACEMLTPDNLCSLQIKFGHEAKPEGCRSYPSGGECFRQKGSL